MIVTESLDSAHLARNVFGNPSRRTHVVYLPPGYETSGRRYPVVYLLHGFSSRSTNWPLPQAMSYGGLRVPIDELLDTAISSGQAGEMIVVMPDGWSRYGCSMWVDSPANGDFEQYVVQDVVAHIDQRYRTIPSAASRGVFGLSSGGFGAWHLATRNPKVFGAFAMISASIGFEVSRLPWFYRYFDRLYPNEPAGPIAGDIGSWFCYALAAAHTPNVARPPYFVDFPVDYPSGDIIPDRWATWQSYDPVENWTSRTAALRGMRGILIDCGYRDENRYHFGNRMLSARLRAAGIAHRSEEHDGGHTDRLFERVQFSYSWLSTALAAT
ncbi:MAG: hypothetical protein QOH08_1379 [Chloroflexota bacterium]|nr:hypothetical protein [Chloroflexota bacterium]